MYKAKKEGQQSSTESCGLKRKHLLLKTSQKITGRMAVNFRSVSLFIMNATSSSATDFLCFTFRNFLFMLIYSYTFGFITFRKFQFLIIHLFICSFFICSLSLTQFQFIASSFMIISKNRCKFKITPVNKTY